MKGLSVAAAIATFATTVVVADSAGCQRNSLPSEVQLGVSKDLSVDSYSIDNRLSRRNYRIHVPDSYKIGSAVPLLFSFHGRGKTAASQEALSQFSNPAYGFEGISVYPEGIAASGTKTQQWQGDVDAPHNIDDVRFTLELIDHLSDTYCIDTSKVYSTGKSNGGGFTGLLACNHDASKKIAAFASVSGAFYLDPNTEQLPACTPGRTVVPFAEFHGTQDVTIPYHGGENTRGNGNSTDIPTYMNAWATRDGFAPNAAVLSTLCSGDKLVTAFKWGETVQHYRYGNFNHSWMAPFANSDSSITTCKEADATALILSWLKQWHL